MFIEVLEKLINKKNLNSDEMCGIMKEILEGKLSDAQIASFLVALRMKGETSGEITSAVKVLKEKGEKLNVENNDFLDIVGTGGSGSGAFNISTASAFVLASGGVKIAKHGGRASSSRVGAADVLEELGANIMLNSEQNEEMLEKTGMCFMFAPKFNPLMKNVAKARSEIKIRTVFNCLGPLINPSGARAQLIGVYDKALVKTVADVMLNLGQKEGMTVFGEGGLDEASVFSKTYFARIMQGEVVEDCFEPEIFGIKKAKIEDLKGGDKQENAKIIRNIFEGKEIGAKKDVVCLNAALGFVLSKKTDNPLSGFELAKKLIESGKTLFKLEQFIKETNEYIR